MIELLKHFREFLGFGASLSLIPKILLSIIICFVGVFLVSMIWSYPSSVPVAAETDPGPHQSKTSAEKTNDVTLGKLVERGDVFRIKAALLASPTLYSKIAGFSPAQTFLVDLVVDKYTFDIAIVPEIPEVSQIAPCVVLIKLFGTKRSLVSLENKRDLDAIFAIAKDPVKAVTTALELRDDYRMRLPHGMYVRIVVVGGQRDLMTKDELNKISSLNAASQRNDIMTYDGLSDLLR